MIDISRRNMMKFGAALAGASAVSTIGAQQASAAGGFQAASKGGPGGPGGDEKKGPGIQNVYAICEVTGGGEKVYGVAIEYDAAINPASLAKDTFTTNVFPAADGYFPGMPDGPDKDSGTTVAKPRSVVAIYTNTASSLAQRQDKCCGHVRDHRICA